MRKYSHPSLQSMASARARYIKKIKRKWGEKWLCTREISSSSAILCKLAHTDQGIPANVSCLSSLVRYQAAENSVITSGAAKKGLFSSRDNCNCWILKQFERTSYFLVIQAWVLRQNRKQKNYAKKSGQRSTFSFLISLFFIISQNACLNFFETAFELLLYRKYGKNV